MNSKHILITGASGLIGTRLTEMLLQRNYSVSHLSRQTKSGKIKSYRWDVQDQFIEPGALENADTIVHLAGSGIADKPWTESRKKNILESRTKSTALLYKELKRTKHNVHSFISASAMGYYGLNNEDRSMVESDQPGKDFLADVVTKWEREIDCVSELNIRTVKLRISVVLSNDGGALVQMAKPIKYYAGAVLGSGDQFLSWIHLDDLCRLFINAIEDQQWQGAYNAVSPDVVTNDQLTKAIAKKIDRPILLPNVPAFVLKILLGEMADLVLKGSKLSSEKIIKNGFTFEFDTLEKALDDLYK